MDFSTRWTCPEQSLMPRARIFHLKPKFQTSGDRNYDWRKNNSLPEHTTPNNKNCKQEENYETQKLAKYCTAVRTSSLLHGDTAQNTDRKAKDSTANAEACVIIFQNANPGKAGVIVIEDLAFTGAAFRYRAHSTLVLQQCFKLQQVRKQWGIWKCHSREFGNRREFGNNWWCNFSCVTNPGILLGIKFLVVAQSNWIGGYPGLPPRLWLRFII